MTDLERLRHSCAHVMATAILRLWPDAQFAYGPPIENGFYYDFDMKHRITPDDFEKIEAEMKKIAKENQKFEYKAISREEAKAMAESGRLGGLTERPGNPSPLQARPHRQDPRGRTNLLFPERRLHRPLRRPARRLHVEVQEREADVGLVVVLPGR